MSTENTAASAASPSSHPQLSGGLYLKGTVIAVRTEQKEWENKKYVQTSIEISDGQNVYTMRYKHDGTPFNPPGLFKEITIRVTYAATEKGKINVRGVLV